MCARDAQQNSCWCICMFVFLCVYRQCHKYLTQTIVFAQQIQFARTKILPLYHVIPFRPAPDIIYLDEMTIVIFRQAERVRLASLTTHGITHN